MLRQAACSHLGAIEALFAERFAPEEARLLAGLLERLPRAADDGYCPHAGDG